MVVPLPLRQESGPNDIYYFISIQDFGCKLWSSFSTPTVNSSELLLLFFTSIALCTYLYGNVSRARLVPFYFRHKVFAQQAQQHGWSLVDSCLVQYRYWGLCQRDNTNAINRKSFTSMLSKTWTVESELLIDVWISLGPFQNGIGQTSWVIQKICVWGCKLLPIAKICSKNKQASASLVWTQHFCVTSTALYYL